MPEQRISDDAKLPAAIGQGLHTDPEYPFEFEQFAPADGIAGSAGLCAQRRCRHQECTGKSVRGLLVINFRCDLKGHMPELVGNREPLALTPIPSIDDNRRHHALVLTTHPSRKSVNARKGHRKDLDAVFLQELDEVRDRLEAKPPVAAEEERRLFRFHHVFENGPRRVLGSVPSDSGQAHKFLDREIALKQVDHPGLDLGFLPSARQPFSPEFDGLKDNLASAEQVADGHSEGGRECDENAGAGKRLVALILADRLRRNPVVNLRFQFPKRQPFRTAGYPNALTYRHSSTLRVSLQNYKFLLVLSTLGFGMK